MYKLYTKRKGKGAERNTLESQYEKIIEALKKEQVGKLTDEQMTTIEYLTTVDENPKRLLAFLMLEIGHAKKRNQDKERE